MIHDEIPAHLIKEFTLGISQLIGNRTIKVWLARRKRHRVDTIASIGRPQPAPIRLFDHGSGFYLMGEGVTPDLLAPIHKIFVSFCRKVRDERDKNKLHQLDVRYRSVRAKDPYWYNRLVMHYPFSPPQRRVRQGEDSD